MTRPSIAQLDVHTRRVRVLKLVMPLLALGILSSLFMFSKTIDPEAAIPYATVDVEDRLREPKMTGANFAGTTSDGASLTISAANVVPGANQTGTAKTVSGQIVTAAGETTQIDAALVALNGTNAAMTGGVVMHSAGYELTTDAMDVAIDHVQVASRGAVDGKGPLGTLNAGQMTLTETPNVAGSYVLVFKSGVRLLYKPVK